MPTKPDPLTATAQKAAVGDAAALEFVCRELQDPLYQLALRMFSRPEDAADATQEALIRIVTNLGSFRGESKLLTWAYTIATRQFLRMAQRPIEATVADAATFGAWLDDNMAEPSAETLASAEYEDLCGEIRIGCTYGMLLSLSRPTRIAYILGDLIGFTDTEGAQVCEITTAAFRQRLSRARRTMRSIMANRCGLIRQENPCHCSHIIEPSAAAGIMDPGALVYSIPGAKHGLIDTGTLDVAAKELDTAEAIAAVFRTDPKWSAPTHVWEELQAAMPTLL